MGQQKPINIFLTEDNEADVFLLEQTFKKSERPFSLNVLEDGEKALLYLTSLTCDEPEKIPDIILLDINLAKLDGLQILERIKKQSPTSTLPIFMLTGSRMSREINTSKDLGANGYIVKGSEFSLDDIVHFARIAKTQPANWVQVGTKREM